MTVKELRDKLAALPDDMMVLHEYDSFLSVEFECKVGDVAWHDKYKQWEMAEQSSGTQKALVIGE